MSTILQNRVCDCCDSSETYTNKKGINVWHNLEGFWLCQKCYDKYLRLDKLKISYKGKDVYLDKNPHKGICSFCNKKIGDKYIDYYGIEKVIKYTTLHHIKYHDDNPLKDTIELCPSCHNREGWRLGQLGK